MSYLALANGIPNFSKAVISLWFRVPKASIDAAAAEIIPPAYSFVLPFTIPLLTFGSPQTRSRYSATPKNVAVLHFTPPPFFGPIEIYDDPTLAVIANDPVDPCFIGLYCEGGKAQLIFKFQMETFASLSGLGPVRTRVDVHNGNTAPANIDILLQTTGSGWLAGSMDAIRNAIYFTTLKDNSNAAPEQPEFFMVEAPVEITPDRWHHLLLSFDLGNSCVTQGPPPNPAVRGAVFWANGAEGTSSWCKLWYAIDDVDYRGRTPTSGEHYLKPYSVDYDISGSSAAQGDPNGILSVKASEVATSGTTYPYNCNFPRAACNYSPGLIPSTNARLGIPAAPDYVDHIYRVEMAELQFFTGVTMDTGVTSKRRAFVSSDGLPVDPVAPATDDPTDQRTPAEVVLGKKPDILLHGSSDWSDGYNTGTIGITTSIVDGVETITKIPSGQFVPTAKIEPWTPDPSLDETTA